MTTVRKTLMKPPLDFCFDPFSPDGRIASETSEAPGSGYGCSSDGSTRPGAGWRKAAVT